jgi:hypothetical protein
MCIPYAPRRGVLVGAAEGVTQFCLGPTQFVLFVEAIKLAWKLVDIDGEEPNDSSHSRIVGRLIALRTLTAIKAGEASCPRILAGIVAEFVGDIVYFIGAARDQVDEVSRGASACAPRIN